jgi:mxaD protein
LNEEAADKAVTDVLTKGLTALAKKVTPSATPAVHIDVKR